MRKIYSLLLALFAVCGLASAEVITVTPTDVSGSQSNIFFSCEKNDGTTAPTFNTNGQDLRIYAKGSIMITSRAGEMTQIVFNISTQGKKRLAPITASAGTIATQAAGDEIVTWTGNANEVIFTVGDKANYGSDGESKAGQFDFNSFEVTVGAADPDFVAAPRITPSTNTYYSAQTVTITADEGCEIFYTTDGYSPIDATGALSQTATAYTEPFSVSETTTVKAVAMKATPAASFFSDVTTSVITIEQAVTYTSIPHMKAAAQSLGTEKQQCEMNTNGLTVIGVKNSNIYVVDYNGEGILLYGSNTMNLVVGDMIGGTIRGQLQLYNGVVELGSVDFSDMSLNHQGVAVTPTEATIGDLTGVDKLNYESGLVVVKGLSFGNATTFAASNTATDASGASIVVYDNYNVIKDQAIGSNATYDVTGVVGYYNGTLQLYPRTLEDLAQVSGGDPVNPDPDQPHQLVGDGLSLGTAYTVEDLNSFDISAKTDTIQKEAWVKAVILGYVKSSSFNADGIVAGSTMDEENKVYANIVIIDAANNSVTAMPALKFMAPVNLASSPAAAKKVREALNLADNPNNVGITVWLNGTITQYMGANGLKEVKKYSLDGTTILPSDDEPTPEPQPGTEIDWTSSAAAPLTVAQALEKGGQLAPKADSGVDVYVKGFVAAVEAIANGSAKYYIADQAAGNANQLYIYNGKGLQGADIAEGGLQQGDEVIVVGRMKNYQQNDGSTILEMTGSKLYSLNGQTEGDNPQPQVEYAAAGTGTLADPYNVDAVRTTNVDDAIKEGVWVKGVIIGFADGSFSTSKVVAGTTKADGSPALASNIVIIDAAHNSEAAMPQLDYMAPVQLPTGDVRAAINLADNASNIGKTVWLYGNIEKYFGVAAVKNVTKYSFDGETVLPSGGDEPGPEPGTEIDWTSSADAPLNVAATMEKAAGLAASAEGDEIYVKGFVTEITEISTQYGNATYYIADHAAGDATQLYVFRGKGIDGADFASESDLAVGDEVLLLGKMKNYVSSSTNESTLELVNSKIISRNGQSEPTPVETVQYASIPEMRTAAQELGTAKQSCEMNTNGLTVIGVKGKNIYVVDYTKQGLLLYGDNTLSLTVGQTIGGTIKGKLQLYNGVTELGDVDYSGMSVLPAAVTAEPVEATIADITNEATKLQYESALVKVSGLNFGDATAFAANTTAYDDSDNEINIYDNYGSITGQAIEVGADYDIVAIVGVYQGAVQLYPRDVNDIVKAGEADLQTPTSKWTSDNVFCGPDEVVNVQFETNSDGAVTYTSSDESVATVDAQGVITTHAVGRATITATTAATATYRSSSDWVNIIVSSAVESVNDVIAQWDGETKREDVRVRGFIVGYVNGQSYQSGAVFFRNRQNAPATRADDEVSNTNLLLATDIDETDVEKCIPVQLPAGNVRNGLNLRDHSEYALAEVELLGDVEKYFGVCGLKNVTAFTILAVQDAVNAIKADTAADAAIYTIDGRRVSTISRPGLYIIGGRKVAVK